MGFTKETLRSIKFKIFEKLTVLVIYFLSYLGSKKKWPCTGTGCQLVPSPYFRNKSRVANEYCGRMCSSFALPTTFLLPSSQMYTDLRSCLTLQKLNQEESNQFSYQLAPKYKLITKILFLNKTEKKHGRSPGIRRRPLLECGRSLVQS